MAELNINEDFIFTAILRRLPVQDLLRVRCVSRALRTLIGTRGFVQAHLMNSIERPSFPHHMIFYETIQGFWQLSLPSLFDNQITHPIPYNGDHLGINLFNEQTQLVGTCDGLVCILLEWRNLVLWNPATRRSRRLPDASNLIRVEENETLQFVRYGFGLDIVNDDYKVYGEVIVGLVVGKNRHAPSRWHRIIYSLRTNTWTEVVERPVERAGFVTGLGMGVYVSGNLHWSLINGHIRDIESFNLHTLAYGVFEPPRYFVEAEFMVGVVRGLLSIHFFDQETDLDVWVMNVYGGIGWSVLVSIPLLDEGDGGMPRYLDIRPTGEVIMIYTFDVLIYDPQHLAFRTPQIIGNNGNLHFYGASCIYVESLASVEVGGNPN